jgi:transcriptional regulator with XRE-family HTH domain
MNSFGRILEKHLKLHGHKKKDLAAQLEVTEAYISIICHGTQPPPTYVRCEKIADFLKLARKDRLDFFKAAIESRAKKDIQVFLDQISMLSTDPEDKASTSFYDKGVRFISERVDRQIPLIRYPKKRPDQPIMRSQTIEQLTVSCIINESFYAISFQEAYDKEIGFKKRDILIIDPRVETISSGDLVLVRLFGDVQVKKIFKFEVGGISHLEFSPVDDNNKLIFEQSSKDYELFGKVAHAVLSFQ